MAILAEYIQLLQENYWLGICLASLLGLMVGSFLNVVIYRLPIMMEQSWRAECQLFLHPEKALAFEEPITLSKPASNCPKCHKIIRWYENIPVVSWLFLRGKCSGCKTPISFRYPFVEIITACASALVFVTFGVTLATLFALGLTWALIALTGIDFDTQLLPDRITLPLAAAGLAVNALGVFTSPSLAIWGYVFGFLSLWLVYKLFLWFTAKHGMGYGDFKLLAALGAWLGAGMLPLIILLSSVLGSIVGLVLMTLDGESKPFAFGPYIAIAGFIALIWGQQIVGWYFS